MIARPDETGPSEAQLIDARDGRLTRAVVRNGVVLQGFDSGDALILREREDAAGRTAWRFFRVDPATNVVGVVDEVPSVGPATSGSEDVDPAHGLAVTIGLASNEQDAALMAAPLGGGPARSIATFASVDRLAIDPTGAGVAVAANGAIRFVTWDGRATELWHGTDSAAAFAWSADGTDLVVATGAAGGSISVVERATGRVVDLPRPADAAQILLVRMIGGVPLPEVALPAAEPTPTPTAAPSGGDLAGAPAVASAWLDPATGSLVLHAERLVPTSAGGMRVAASMTPVDLGPAGPDTDASVRILPRPRSEEILLWVDTGNRAEGWSWDGRSERHRLSLPHDWPGQAFDVAWRPDGAALGGGADAAAGDVTPGDATPVFVVAAPGDTRTKVIHARGEYDRFEGWWSTSSLRIGHVICMEGCPGRYAVSARLRLSDGKVTPFAVADRGHGPIDEVFGDGRGGLVMTPFNTITADAIHIDWPLGGSSDGPQFVGWAADGRSLLVASEARGGLDLYRVDDPAGRAVRGRMTNPAPTLLGHLAHRDLEIGVSPDARWATATDRTGAAELVELATGRAWPLGRDRVLAWWPLR
jgi:hypothetical protein